MTTVATTTDEPAVKTPPGPGVFPDIPFNEYLSWPYVNNTSLGPMLRSPKHYKLALDKPREPTEAMLKGVVAHLAALEPLKIADYFVVMPDLTGGIKTKNGSPSTKPRGTEEYKSRVEEFTRANATKEIIDQQAYDDVKGMIAALAESERATEYLASTGRPEVAIVWDDPDTLLRCKARIDRLHHTPRRMTDLKTARDVLDFERAIYNFGYHRQSAFYSDGQFFRTGERHESCIVAVEPTAPYGVRAAPVSDVMLAAGRESYQKALRRIADCRERDEWPGYDDPAEWNLPAWAQKNSEAVTLNIGGEVRQI